MTRLLALTIFTVLLASAPLYAEPKAKEGRSTEARIEDAQAINDFQGEDIGVVLRALARNAKINMVVDDQISGTHHDAT